MRKNIIGALVLGMVLGGAIIAGGLWVISASNSAAYGAVPEAQSVAPCPAGTYQMVTIPPDDPNRMPGVIVMDTRTGVAYVSFYLRPQINMPDFQFSPARPYTIKLVGR